MIKLRGKELNEEDQLYKLCMEKDLAPDAYKVLLKMSKRITELEDKLNDISKGFKRK